MDDPGDFVRDLLGRIRIMRPTGEILFRVEPVPCDKRMHEGLTSTLPGADPRFTDEQLRYEALKLLLANLGINHPIPINKSEKAIPPRFGERILLLILRTKEERINMPGDLEEECRVIAAKHGARYAKLWYYKQVVGSAWPIIRSVIGWGLLTGIGAWLRRHI